MQLNLFPHPQPLSQRWERGDTIDMSENECRDVALQRLYKGFR
jgi:hypothetical protein